MTDQFHHRARKDLGQHFLTDPNVIQNIVRAIAPQQGQRIIEIGPGLGALSTELLKHTGKIEVIEIDSDVLSPLQKQCAGFGELIIHHQDVLTFDFSALTSKIRLVGNLPYNISSPLIFHVLAGQSNLIDMHFMLQKEVVDRMSATVGSKNYGRLSVMVQYFCHVEPLFKVKPGSFRPPPKVDSSVVRLIPRDESELCARDPERLSKIVKVAFATRRKTLRNNFKGILSPEQLANIGIDAQGRAEQLNVQDFINIANIEV